MGILSNDPGQLRLGTLMMLATVPFLLYASYVKRREPEVAALGVVISLVFLVICVAALRRASRLGE